MSAFDDVTVEALDKLRGMDEVTFPMLRAAVERGLSNGILEEESDEVVVSEFGREFLRQFVAIALEDDKRVRVVVAEEQS